MIGSNLELIIGPIEILVPRTSSIYLTRNKVINGLKFVICAAVYAADLRVAIRYLGLKGVLGDVKGLLLGRATSLAYCDYVRC
jgi:hypothetical protein